jgi:hypothetical protein
MSERRARARSCSLMGASRALAVGRWSNVGTESSLGLWPSLTGIA